MDSNLKKLGWFSLSTAPLILCLIMQAVVGSIGMAVHALVKIIRDPAGWDLAASDMEAFMELYMEYALAGAGSGIFAYHVAGTTVFGLWYYLACIRPVKHIPREGKALNWPMAGWSVAIGITLCIFCNQFIKVGEYVAPRMVENFYDLMERVGFDFNVLAIFAAIILAPVGEELLCRGVIQHYAMKVSKRFWVANVIQATMFGIMHLNWVQGTYAFIVGLVLGWLKYRYNSLWVPVIIHFVINFSSSSWLAYLLDMVPRGFVNDFGIMALAAAVTAGILVLIGKKEEIYVNNEEQQPVNYE